MFALMAALTPVFLTVSAYAAELPDDREGSIGGGRYSYITSTMDDLVGVMNEVWNVMTSNPLLLVFLGVSLFGVGIRLFKKVKSAAKR